MDGRPNRRKKLRFKSKSSESKLKKEREYARLFLFYHSTLIPVYPHWKKAKLVWFKISISFILLLLLLLLLSLLWLVTVIYPTIMNFLES